MSEIHFLKSKERERDMILMMTHHMPYEAAFSFLQETHAGKESGEGRVRSTHSTKRRLTKTKLRFI